jgi:hypothetical protein
MSNLTHDELIIQYVVAVYAAHDDWDMRRGAARGERVTNGPALPFDLQLQRDRSTAVVKLNTTPGLRAEAVEAIERGYNGGPISREEHAAAITPEMTRWADLTAPDAPPAFTPGGVAPAYSDHAGQSSGTPSAAPTSSSAIAASARSALATEGLPSYEQAVGAPVYQRPSQSQNGQRPPGR